jgi:hypothetical protein
MSFNETLARQISDKAKEEDAQRMSLVKDRRNDMRATFTTRKTTKEQELDASRLRHEADIQRFKDVRAKDAEVAAAEERQRAEAARLAAEAERRDTRRGTAELEATLQRLGVDGGESRVRLGPTVRTTILGQSTQHRAPRDAHETEAGQAELDRERRAHNAEIISRIRARRLEDTEARREKAKRQWRMEGELAKSAAELTARADRATWIAMAKELAPVERQRAFQHLKQCVVIAAAEAATVRENAGLRAIAERGAADADAKFSIVARAMKVQQVKAFDAELSKAQLVEAAFLDEKRRDAEAYCRHLAAGIVTLAQDVIDYNETRIQQGVAASVLEPLGATQWRGLVDKRTAMPSFSTTKPKTPQTRRSSIAKGAFGNSLSLTRGATKTPEVASRPNETAAVDLFSDFVDEVAALDAAALCKNAHTAINERKLRHHRSVIARDLSERLHSTPLRGIVLLGTEAARYEDAFDSISGAGSAGNVKIVSKRLLADADAAVAAADADGADPQLAVAKSKPSTAPKEGKGKSSGRGAAEQVPEPSTEAPAMTAAERNANLVDKAVSLMLPTATDAQTPVVVYAGFTAEEFAAALQRIGTHLEDSVAVAVLDVPLTEIVRRTVSAAKNRRTIDPAAIHASAHHAKSANDNVGKEILGDARLLWRIPTDIDEDAAVAPTVEHAASLLRTIEAAIASDEELRPIDASRSSQPDAQRETLTLPVDAMAQLFADVRRNEWDFSMNLRTSISAILTELQLVTLPTVPAETASAAAKHEFWMGVDAVRAATVEAIGEVLEEAKSNIDDLMAVRLHLFCHLLLTAAEGHFGAASSTVPAPTREQCKAFIESQLGEVALLPTATAGAIDKQRAAFETMLKELSLTVVRSVDHAVAQLDVAASVSSWAPVADEIIRTASAHFNIVAHWHADVATAASVWLQARVNSASNALLQVASSPAAFLDVTSVMRLEKQYIEDAVKDRTRSAWEVVLSLVAEPREYGSGRLLPFGARHFRLQEAAIGAASATVEHVLLAAQVSAHAGQLETDDAIIPAKTWWYREPTHRMSSASISADPLTVATPAPGLGDSGRAPLPDVGVTFAGSRPPSQARIQANSGARRSVVASSSAGGGKGPNSTASRPVSPPSALVSGLDGVAGGIAVPPPAAAIATPVPSLLGFLRPAQVRGTLRNVPWPACEALPHFVAALAAGNHTTLEHQRSEPRKMPTPLTTAKIQATARQISEAVVDAASAPAPAGSALEAIRSGELQFLEFKALQCWSHLSSLAVRSLYEALKGSGETAGVAVRSIMEHVCSDKLDTRAVENLFAFCQHLLRAPVPGVPAGDLPWSIFHQVLPQVSADDVAASACFGADATEKPPVVDPAPFSVSTKSALLSPWGRASFAAAKSRGLRLPSVAVIEWAK